MATKMMNMADIIMYLVVLSCSFTFPLILAKTPSDDVSALNNMFQFMNSPSQLDWKTNGGDPCGDSWKGISCSDNSVTEIDLSGLGLSGSIGYELSKLKSVTYFDMSNNNFNGDIPYQLPPNAQHIDLSGNGFTGSGLPWSISQMTEIKYLNLNHNQLKGQLSDIFTKLTKLTELDLSQNQLSGNLPQGFQSLTRLSKLHLQNNQLTGHINVLASLPLDDLDVSNNQFTGWVPNELKHIKRIKTGGNSWSSGPSPPSPPGTRRHSRNGDGDDDSGLGGAAIAGIVLGVLVIILVIVGVVIKKKSSPLAHSSHFLEDDRLSQRRPFTPLHSQELVNQERVEKRKSFRDVKSFKSSSSIKMNPILPLPPPDFSNSSSDDDYSGLSVRTDYANHMNGRRSTSIQVSTYNLVDLQTATGNFATGRLLGEGSIGRVYKAKYADGRVLAVKKIDSSFFQGGRGPEFTEIISTISKLRHPNIAELAGYCVEQGQHMLVCDYFRNGSLHEYLHMSDDFSKPLTWNTRVRIALGAARAIEYLHEVCSPSCVHKNIKSSNILLDLELNPHLSDCGLAIFHERTSQNLGAGYNAPECTKPSAYTLKSDVYSFGVVMLELLTGRMPFDSSKPKVEQTLVRWAAPQLHDIEALAKMVDPALRGLYPPKSLSRFADIIALAVQSEPEFRPPMSEVVEALVRLVQRASMNLELSASQRSDDYY